MRLGQLLAELDSEALDRLCSRVVPGAENVQPQLRATSIESVLRDSGSIESSLFQQRPPVVAILRELLEAREYRAPLSALRPTVMAVTDDWCERVGNATLASRRDSFRIYLRLLAGAWGNDLRLDASELSLLGLLRAELGMTALEHFLISHHPDIQTYWRTADCFDDALAQLVEAGIVFVLVQEAIVPEEFVRRIQNTVGLQSSRGAAIRLLDYLSSDDLRNALDEFGLKKSGDKAERIARIIDEMMPVSEVLSAVHIHDLQHIARESGAAVAGAKDELITRLIDYFEAGGDLKASAEGNKSETIEPKVLKRSSFERLLCELSNHQLELLCRRNDLHHTGTKEHRIDNLWESSYAERTLLRGLRNPDLAELCRAHGLDASGSKDTMIERLIAHASS